MRTVSFRVRFASGTKQQLLLDAHTSSSAATPPSTVQRWKKSRMGCRECKARHVKCDETFPVCLRCQRRGSVCLSEQRSTQWQTEMPWLSPNSPSLGCFNSRANTNKRLLQYWLEKSSQMMSLDSSNNPLSFPLLPRLLESPSLVHAVQSVSAGHESFFDHTGLQTCLRERGLAIELVREELRDAESASISSLLTVFFLGVSAAWTEQGPYSYGKEHLAGAQAMLKFIMADKQHRNDPLITYLLGWFLYWDMSCSFIADPDAPSPLDTTEVLQLLQESGDPFHPMIGFSAELYYLVGRVGKHCRLVIERGDRDFNLEKELEERLLSWNPPSDHQHLANLAIAYRNHALIMLFQICNAPDRELRIARGTEPDLAEAEGTEAVIQSYAMQSLQRMLDTPSQEGSFNFQSIPLFTAGAELRRAEGNLRQEVVNRFKALYSCNRIAVNMWAADLLQELWSLRDAGIGISWIELLLQKNWQLTFA